MNMIKEYQEYECTLCNDTRVIIEEPLSGEPDDNLTERPCPNHETDQYDPDEKLLLENLY